MAWSLLNHMIAEKVEELLDTQKDAYGPSDERFFSREVAASIIHAAIWGYSCRSSSTAGCYAAMNLYNALGLKWWTFDEAEAAAAQTMRLQLAQAARDAPRASVSDGSPEGVKTGTGLIEDDSAAAIAETPLPNSPLQEKETEE